MSDEPQLRRARPEDVPSVERLLTAERLPPLAIREHLDTFWVLDTGAEIVGCAGLEVYGRSAVLRSVAVTPTMRGGRQGRRLVEAALEEARRHKVRRVYLFTVHAAPFFVRLGFAPCSMEDFDLPVRKSWQYEAMTAHPALRQDVTAMCLYLSGC